MADYQRSRLLSAALEEATERGTKDTCVSVIVTRAGVSRKTFYEIFESREDCFLAVFEESIAEIAGVVGSSYEGDGKWSERVRAALEALLGFLEAHRDMGRFMLDYIVGDASRDSDLRLLVIERLQSVIDEGRLQTRRELAYSPLTAEVVVGGVLAVLHTRLEARRQPLAPLVSSLMSMIVLPYLGAGAAARELQRTAPKPAAATRSGSARGPLDGLQMRVTYRTARVLATIAEEPGFSNTEIGERVEVSDPGQISKLLARLARLGLVENSGPGQATGCANAWRLTSRGREVDAAIRREFAADSHSWSRR